MAEQFGGGRAGIREGEPHPESNDKLPNIADARRLDSKGRLYVEDMTARELQEEAVVNLRSLLDTLAAVGQNPMLRAMMPPGFGG